MYHNLDQVVIVVVIQQQLARLERGTFRTHSSRSHVSRSHPQGKLLEAIAFALKVHGQLLAIISTAYKSLDFVAIAKASQLHMRFVHRTEFRIMRECNPILGKRERRSLNEAFWVGELSVDILQEKKSYDKNHCHNVKL